MNEIIHAYLSTSDCDTQFLVNDIPVGVLQYRNATVAAVPIHEFLIRGENTAEIRRLDTGAPLRQDRNEASAPAEPAESGPCASLTIAKYPVGTFPSKDGGTRIAAVAYQANETLPDREERTIATFQLNDWAFEWSWQHLAPIELRDPNVKARLFGFLKEFATRFSSGDAPWIASVLHPKMSDYCQAYGMSLQDEIDELKWRMDRRTSDPAFKMLSLVQDEFAPVSCAADRLVDCVDRNGEPIIKWHDSRVGDSGAMRIRVGLDVTGFYVYR